MTEQLSRQDIGGRIQAFSQDLSLFEGVFKQGVYVVGAVCAEGFREGVAFAPLKLELGLIVSCAKHHRREYLLPPESAEERRGVVEDTGGELTRLRQ